MRDRGDRRLVNDMCLGCYVAYNFQHRVFTNLCEGYITRLLHCFIIVNLPLTEAVVFCQRILVLLANV